MDRSSLLKSLVLVIAGFVIAYLVLTYAGKRDAEHIDTGSAGESSVLNLNPFSTDTGSYTDMQRIEMLEANVFGLKQQLQDVEQLVEKLSETIANYDDASSPATGGAIKPVGSKRRPASVLNQRLYNLDNLIRGGIDPSRAEDIIRRKNRIQLRRLELQDRATRENYLNTQRYYDELDAINQDDVTLREELGDQGYDEYLFESKQNNRVWISSVMLGSAAEDAGILKGDVVLSYDDQQMFTWDELKDATASGELGEYVSITIYRDGEIFSFSVPRGPLGVQLGSTRLEP